MNWSEHAGPVVRKAPLYRVIDYAPRVPRYMSWYIPVLNQPSRMYEGDDLQAAIAACEAHHASILDLVAQAEVGGARYKNEPPRVEGV